MPDLSICLPYYMNPGMLAHRYERWAAWPSELKARVEIVIVDDASPTGHASDVARPPGLPRLSIYRVVEDVPWHQDGARNLAAHVATGDWLLLTDMDHLLEGEAAAALVAHVDAGRLQHGCIYTLARIKASTGEPKLSRDGQPKPHPNSYVVKRDTYWHVGGYDESLCGFYGTDGIFRWRAQHRATLGHLDDVALLKFTEKEVSDATTQTLSRGAGNDDVEFSLRKAAALKRGIDAPVPVLTFAWERVV